MRLAMVKINRHIYFSEILFNILYKNKIRNICISPGSRSTSLIFALEKFSFNTIVHFDERVLAFFALGQSRVSDSPSAVITTSGTAVAELYPAIIEAYYQRIPLIIITADRPEWQRNIGTNQTINQKDIFANHIRCSLDINCNLITKDSINSFIHSVEEAVSIAITTNPGPVHINIQFDKPFEPDKYTDELDSKIINYKAQQIKTAIKTNLETIDYNSLITGNGIIICGPNNYNDKDLEAIISIGKKLNYPVVADGCSNLRKIDKSNIYSFYHHYIQEFNSSIEQIISFGNFPVSNALLNFYKSVKSNKILVNKFNDICDPTNSLDSVLPVTPSELDRNIKKINRDNIFLNKSFNLFETTISRLINRQLVNSFYEPAIMRFLVDSLPENSNIVISNSMPVRDFDMFVKNHHGKNIFSLRGASGIDGLISFSTGLTTISDKPTYLIIGDISFLYDVSALILAKNLKAPLKIIVINNNGGGIFRALPVSEFSEVCEKYFIIPHNTKIKKLTKAYGGHYFSAKNLKSLKNKFKLFIAASDSFSLIEIITDSQKSQDFRNQYRNSVYDEIKNI